MVCFRDIINPPQLYFLNNCLIYQNSDLILKFYNISKFLDAIKSLPNEKYLILNREPVDPNKISLKAKKNHRDLVCGMRLEAQAQFQMRYMIQSALIIRSPFQNQEKKPTNAKNLFKTRVHTTDHGNPESLFNNQIENNGIVKNHQSKNGKDLQSFINQVTSDNIKKENEEQNRKPFEHSQVQLAINGGSRLIIVDDVYLYKLNNAARLIQIKKLDYFRAQLIPNYELNNSLNKIYLFNQNDKFLYIYNLVDLSCFIRIKIDQEIENCIITSLANNAKGSLASIDIYNKVSLSDRKSVV